MKVQVSNQGTTPVTLPGYVDVAAGTSANLTGLNVFQAAIIAGLSSRYLLVEFSADPADLPIEGTVAQTPANPGASVKSLAGVGVQVQDRSLGTNISFAEQIGLAVFDDAACLIPSVTATLATPAGGDGSIQVGSGTNAIQCTTNASGLFECTVTIPSSVAVPKNVWIKATQNPNGSRILDASGSVHEVSFT